MGNESIVENWNDRISKVCFIADVKMDKEQVDSNLGNYKKKKKVGRGRPKNMTLVEVVKDMLIKEVIETMIMNRI